MPIEVSRVAKDAQDSVNFSARGSRTLKRVVAPQQQEGTTIVIRQTTAATLGPFGLNETAGWACWFSAG